MADIQLSGFRVPFAQQPGAIDTAAPARRGLQNLSRQAADILTGIADRKQRAENTTALISAVTQADEAQIELLRDAEAQSGTGGDGLVKSWAQGFEARQQDIMGGLPGTVNEIGRQQITERLAQMRLGFQRQAAAREDELRKDWQDRTLQDSHDSAARLARSNPDDYGQLLGREVARIEALKGTAFGSDEVAQRTEAVSKQVADAALDGLLAQGDFETARMAIKPGEGRFSSLFDEAERRAIDNRIDSEEAEAWSRARRADSAADDERKERQRETALEGDRMAIDGTLDRSWLQENADSLAAKDRRYFLRRLENPDSAGDPSTYADLRLRAGRGEDVTDDARRLFSDGRLNRAQFEKLSGLRDTAENETFRRGDQFIRNMLQVSDLNPDPAAQQRYAVASDAWRDWLRRNPDAEDEKTQKAYQRIAREYALIDPSNSTLLLPVPRFAVGNRVNLDLDATADATARAYEEGQLSRDELGDQALLLKQWQAAIERQRQLQGAPKE